MACGKICLRIQETQETPVPSLGQEDTLGKEMANHSSILTMEDFMDRGAWQATVHGFAESDMTGQARVHTYMHRTAAVY